MTTRISQLLAVVAGVRNDVQAQLTGLQANVTTHELVTGLEKTYRPRAEPQPGEAPPLRRPDQRKSVQVTVPDVLDRVTKLLTRQLDVTRTLDEAKTHASADVVIDNQVILRDVNTDHLVYLEARLGELFAFLSTLPVLDPAETWTNDGTEPGQWKTRAIETTSEDTVYFNHTLVPAQVIDGILVEPKVEIMKRSEVVGYWTTVKFSGGIHVSRKRELLDRVNKAREAVKMARELANMDPVEDVSEGAELCAYLFG